VPVVNSGLLAPLRGCGDDWFLALPVAIVAAAVIGLCPQDKQLMNAAFGLS
jgi:hypothetical protein